MVVTTKAIVISALKYSEADLIVKLFTQSSGLKTYILRSVFKSKRGKIRVSQFQPLTQLDIVAKHKDKGTLEHLTEVKIQSHYETLHTDVYKSTVVLFLAEILKNAIQEEEKNEELFDFITASFSWFDKHEAPNFHILFLLKLSRFLGFYPETEHQDNPLFNLADGTFQFSKTSVYCISGDTVNYLKTLLGINFDGLASMKLSRTSRLGLLECLLTFYELHLHGFKTPKSLTVLKDIYS